MANFQIITDTQTYTDGTHSSAFKALGHDSVRLQDLGYDGDYVVLYYEHDLELRIPEARIQHIASTAA